MIAARVPMSMIRMKKKHKVQHRKRRQQFRFLGGLEYWIGIVRWIGGGGEVAEWPSSDLDEPRGTSGAVGFC